MPLGDDRAVRGRGLHVAELEHDVARPKRRRIRLDRAHLGDVEPVLSVVVDQVDDPFRAVARVELVADEVRIRLVGHRIVRADDPALGRVECRRKLVEGDHPGPLARPVGTGDGPGTVVIRGRSDGDGAGHLVPDMTIDVGVDEVLRRGDVAGERRLEAVEIRRRHQLEERLDGTVRTGIGRGRRPAQGHQRRVLEAWLDVVEDRAVDGLADRHVDRISAFHEDPFGPLDEAARRTTGSHVAARVARVGCLDDEVLDIRIDVRGSPRDPRVVAEDDPRDPRERDAGDVVWTRRRDGRAMQPVDVPDRRHRDAQVRVVRDERTAGRRHGRADDPVIRTHRMIRDQAAVRRVETGHGGRVADAPTEVGPGCELVVGERWPRSSLRGAGPPRPSAGAPSPPPSAETMTGEPSRFGNSSSVRAGSPSRASARYRNSSEVMLPPRFHAWTLPHASVSSGVQGSGSAPVATNARPSLSRCVSSQALTPAA